ncbi:rhodanese-like domain-containing protein [Phytoactinopolyspora sp. XMNu-373]|uniref:Rhodanese-like domain-containing protein n=2 Tax=Phytoactinopolyspora mesophila TaxID=2650750 RepID=A0A7K3LWT5_9ACTN|nr:rhodanese-like domain-containing protein [Phytoactinopolyspora mesophila]NDL55479.1 rhodanese-like domain-containing protein [Phytoactinopolyspora mesophila]
MVRSGDVVVDVRLPEEYASGHVAGAVNIPLRELPARIGELPHGQIVTVCSLGNRSLRGAQTLARLGRTAFSLRGGTKAWEAAGLPTVAGPEPVRARRRRFPWRWFSR